MILRGANLLQQQIQLVGEPWTEQRNAILTNLQVERGKNRDRFKVRDMGRGIGG